MNDDLAKQLRAKNAYCAPDFSTPIADPVKLKAADRIEELEAKLAKAVEFTKIVEKCGNGALWDLARTTLAELTGDKDE